MTGCSLSTFNQGQVPWKVPGKPVIYKWNLGFINAWINWMIHSLNYGPVLTKEYTPPSFCSDAYAFTPITHLSNTDVVKYNDNWSGKNKQFISLYILICNKTTRKLNHVYMYIHTLLIWKFNMTANNWYICTHMIHVEIFQMSIMSLCPGRIVIRILYVFLHIKSIVHTRTQRGGTGNEPEERIDLDHN